MRSDEHHDQPLTATGSIAKLVRQLSKLTSGAPVVREAHSTCKITRGQAANAITVERSHTQSQGVGDCDILANDSFLEPGGDDVLLREPSITFGGPRHAARAFSGAVLTRVRSLGPRVQLVAEPSQGYLARTLVDEGSQAEVKAPEPDITKLIASAQQAQLAEITVLTMRLRQKEQEVKDAAAQRQRADVAAAQREQEQAAALQQAQQQFSELQGHVEELSALVSTAASSGELKARLEKVWHRVADLEAQVAALEADKAHVSGRCSELQQRANTILELVHGVSDLPGFGSSSSADSSEDGVVAVGRLVAQHMMLQEMYLSESRHRRDLHNQLMDMKGAVRVFCRVRPVSEKEEESGVSSACQCDSLNGSVEVMCGRMGGIGKDGRLSADLKQLRFIFDQVYGPSSTQEKIFRDMCPIATSVLDGFNACIFAYGQTGSGKTYTMEGTSEERGINYRTMEEIFCMASKRCTVAQYTMSLSLMEVYMEQITDLIGGKDRLEVKLGSAGMQIPGLTEVEVTTAEQAWGLLQKASAARHAAETQMNKSSSRSHCLLCLRVDGKSRLTSDAWRSRLWLIDLAGSERVAKTEATGELLKEAQFINKSLSALGDCIYALASKSSHIPFRNSKLTYLLQESLAGAGKTLMIVNVNPDEENAPETVCSLNFASRVRGVELGTARKNVVADTIGGSEAVKELKAVVGELQEQVASLETERRTLSEQLAASSQHIEHLQAQLAANGSNATSHHRSGSVAAAFLVGRSDGVTGATSMPYGGTPGSASSRLGWTRPLSAPRPEQESECPRDAPTSGLVEQGHVRLGGLRQFTGHQVPTPGFLLPEEGFNTRSPLDSSDSHVSSQSSSRFRAPPAGQRPKTPLVPRLQFSQGPPAAKTTPKTTPRTTGTDSSTRSIKAKKLRSVSPGADYASNGGASGPNSARSQEGSRSAPSSAGRVMRPATASPGSTGSSIKSWRPETAVAAKFAPAKGRWS